MPWYYLNEQDGKIIHELVALARKGQLPRQPPPPAQTGDSGDREIYECRLTSALEAGGTATARLKKWNFSSEDYELTGSEFTVYDDHYRALSGESGAEATFMWRHGRRVLIGVVCA